MKIIICGDSHIGALFGLGKTNKDGSNSRLDDYERTLNHIVDYAIENKADVFIQTGDAFDSRTPTAEHINVLNKAIKKLSMANITSIVIMGNHDYRRMGEKFTSAISSLPAKDYPNVRLVLNPEVVSFSNGISNKANVLLMPYRDRRMYSGANVEEDSSLYQKEMEGLLNDCEEGVPIVAVGHNFFYDGSYNDYGGTEILVKPNTFKKCDVAIMGHYHTFKVIRKKEPSIFYIGSMEKLNFGDQKTDKVFAEYNTETKKIKIIKSPTRQLLDAPLDLSESNSDTIVSDFLEKIKELDFKEKIVRIKLLVKDALISSVNKSEFEKIIYNEGAFFVSKIIIEPIISRIIRNDAILKHKDDYSMFEAFLKNQNDLSENEIQHILDEVKDIIEV